MPSHFRPLLAAIWILNMGLLIWWLAEPEAPTLIEEAAVSRTVSAAKPFESGIEDAATGAPTDTTTLPWSKLSRREILEILKRDGAPPYVLMALAQQVVNAEGETKRAAILRLDELPKWQRNRPPPSPEREQALKDLLTWKRAEMRRLLGDPIDVLGADSAAMRRIAFRLQIAPERMPQTGKILRDYNEMRSELRKAVGSEGGRAEAERLLDDNLMADLKAVLTDSEYQHYRRFESPWAKRLEQSLIGIQIVETDFVALSEAMLAQRDQGALPAAAAGTDQAKQVLNRLVPQLTRAQFERLRAVPELTHLLREYSPSGG